MVRVTTLKFITHFFVFSFLSFLSTISGLRTCEVILTNSILIVTSYFYNHFNYLSAREENAENSEDLDEVTHNKPPHLDLHCPLVFKFSI